MNLTNLEEVNLCKASTLAIFFGIGLICSHVFQRTQINLLPNYFNPVSSLLPTVFLKTWFVSIFLNYRTVTVAAFPRGLAKHNWPTYEAWSVSQLVLWLVKPGFSALLIHISWLQWCA